MKRRNSFIAVLLSVFLLSAYAQETDYFELGKQLEILSAVSSTLLDNYIEAPNMELLTNEAVKGMLSGTDRYTSFYTEQQMFDQRLRRAGKMSGIGVKVRNKEKGLSIRDIIPDSPAEKAGLMPGDLIVEIEGKKLDDLSAKARMNLLKGKPGTQVRIKVKRRDRTLSFNLKRAVIEQKAVPFYTMLEGQTGYIKLNRFSSKAYDEVLDALMELKKRGARSLILDLRDNPGGLLSQAVKITSLFIPKGELVVSTRGRFEKFDKEYRTRTTSADEKIPLAVIVNNRSASASEIVAGALQDYDRAIIVGDTSYGKGLVQRFYPLKYGTYLKVTISKYYIPSGRQIQKIDYWHRDKKGKATVYKQDSSRVFYTRNGRKVFEHGGITPDVILPGDTLNELIKDLRNKDALFDFATEYFYARHKDTSAYSDPLFVAEAFMRYLKRHEIDPQTASEKYLEKAINKLGEKDASPLYEKLRTLSGEIDQEDFRRLTRDPVIRHQLTKLLLTELIRRRKGTEAAEQYQIRDDPVVKRAIRILQSEEYRNILRKQ